MNGKNKRWREIRWEERQAERLQQMELRRYTRQKRLRHEHIENKLKAANVTLLLREMRNRDAGTA